MESINNQGEIISKTSLLTLFILDEDLVGVSIGLTSLLSRVG